MGLFGGKDKESKKVKKQKKGKGNAAMSSEEVSTQEQTERALILLIDKKLPNLQKSFIERGLNVSVIYNDIEDMKIGLLMQSGYSRIVIVESGLGTFTTTSQRGELKDLIGMCNDEDKRLTVFYTDSVVKSDNIKTNIGKQADWVLYTTIADVIKKLKEYNETYVLTDDVVTDRLLSVDDALQLRGEYVEEANYLVETNEQPISIEGLRQLVVRPENNPEALLPEYDVEY